jgi:protocatechuate 3,4-dioxygenase beta subunit
MSVLPTQLRRQTYVYPPKVMMGPLKGASRTVKPGAYPVPVKETWWRPPHLRFSVLGPSSLSRLVTQMYFRGDPLNALHRILNSIPDVAARERLIARDLLLAEVGDQWLGFTHDIVLRGRHATPAVP